LAGEVATLLGRNGMGKTATVKAQLLVLEWCGGVRRTDWPAIPPAGIATSVSDSRRCT
jgi:ABC-type branched-subunit amino acid transport system ATPase component